MAALGIMTMIPFGLLACSSSDKTSGNGQGPTIAGNTQQQQGTTTKADNPRPVDVGDFCTLWKSKDKAWSQTDTDTLDGPTKSRYEQDLDEVVAASRVRFTQTSPRWPSLPRPR
jgi:hypothetical protein